MKNTLSSLLRGLKFGLLAGLCTLAAELVYSYALLPYPVRCDGRLLLLYGAVFGVLGLGGGLAGVVLRRFGSAVPVVVVGATMTALLLSLRIHDLLDAPFNAGMDGGLALFAVTVAMSTAWLAASTRRPALAAAPTVVLAWSVPALVVACKLLVNSAAFSVSQPVPVALAVVALWPIVVTLAYRLVVGRFLAATLAGMAWLAPVAAIVLCALAARPQPARERAGAATAAGALPPIVWVTVDTLRADHLSLYGYQRPTTPNLDAFAKDATVYTSCVAPGPSTWMSVPSLLSSLSPYRHGGVTETRRVPEQIDMLPELLQRLGYQTIGQSANPWVSDRYGMAQGFDDFRLYNTDNELLLYDVMKLAMRVAPWDLFRVREYLPPFAIVPFGRLVDEARGLLATHDAAHPLFLYMQPVDPHGPYQAPLRFVPDAGSFTRTDYVSYWNLKRGVPIRPRQLDGLIALYDGAIAYTDAELGRLFRILRKAGLYDQAMIIVTSDHGEQFFDHGLWRHSNSVYQSLLHIPLVIKYPGQRQGSVVREPVGGIDIMPTVLRALGEGCPSCEGRALQTAGAGDPPPLFTYLMGKQELRPMIRSVMAHGWKLIQSRTPGDVSDRLFNVDRDPREQDDQLVQHNDIAAYLAGLLDRYQEKAGPTLVAHAISLKPAETERLRALGYVQ